MMTAGFRPSPETKVAAMVARHGDAELIGAAMARFGVELICGAGAGGRKEGPRRRVRATPGRARPEGRLLFVMTADVPPGPARRAGIGIVMIARLSGRPIVPCAAATSRFRALNTWSRMTINLPGSQLAYVAGDPIWVPHDAGEAELEFARVQARAGSEWRNRPRLRDRRRRRETRDAFESRRSDVTTRRSGFPPQGLSHRHEPVAPHRAADPQDTRAQRQGGRRAGAASASGRPNIARPNGVLCWFHAASVGETNAVLPLIEALATSRARPNFLLTTGTVTSAGLAELRLGPRAIHQYVPLDAPEYAARFLDHWQPDLAVFTESEIWPTSFSKPRRATFPSRSSMGACRARSFRRWQRNRRSRVRCSAASSSCWRRTSAWRSASRRSARRNVLSSAT